MFNYQITKTIVSTCFLSASMLVAAQDKNELLDRNFWKTNPTVEQVEQKIAAGNDPAAIDNNQFDATSMAIAEKVSNDVIFYLAKLDGNSPTKKTHDGRTYLYWAAANGNIEVMKFMLENGADIKHVDEKGATALIYTATSGQLNPEVYELLVKGGANLKQETNKAGANVILLLANHFKTLDQTTYFVKQGLSLKSVDDLGYNMYAYATKGGKIEFLEALASEGISPLATAKDGGNAFMMATQAGRGGGNSLEFYQYLEKLGINPAVSTTTGNTPLHNVARVKEGAIIDYFMKAGNSVNEVNENGETPFMVAANGQREMDNFSKFLAQAKNLNQKNKYGQTALTLATMGNSEEVMKAIIAVGGNVEILDNDGNNLSYYLIRYTRNLKDYNNKLELLMTFGFKHSKLQENKSNLLHLAVRFKKYDLLKSLVADKAIDINALNGDGLTPLHIAASTAEDESILLTLISLGADKTVVSEFGETAYDLASENELLAAKKIKYSFLK